MHKPLLTLSIWLLVSFSNTAFAGDWTWHVKEVSWQESVIAITGANGDVHEVTLNCNVDGAVSKHSQQVFDAESDMIDESPTIDTVVPDTHPEGLLIVTCTQGAHARAVNIIDPIESSQTPTFIQTGSYVADWTLKHGHIVISYDRPCNTASCEAAQIGFEIIEQAWPTAAESLGPSSSDH